MEETPKKEEPAQKAEPSKKEEKREKVTPTNCAKCNKAFTNKIWYYRNGKYYCNKTCWRSSTKTEKKASDSN